MRVQALKTPVSFFHSANLWNEKGKGNERSKCSLNNQTDEKRQNEKLWLGRTKSLQSGSIKRKGGMFNVFFVVDE